MSSYLKFAIELQAVYLRGTTYLRTPLFGIIPVVTLFVKGAGAVDEVTNDTIRHDTTGRSLRYKFTARIFTRHTLVCCFLFSVRL